MPDEKIMISRKAGWDVYATNKRLILKKGGIFGTEIVEAPYRQITSVKYVRRISLGWIVAGICVAAFGICVAVFGTYLGPIVTHLVFGNPWGWYPWYRSATGQWQFQMLWSLIIICGAILIAIGVALSAAATVAPVFTIFIIDRKPIKLRGKRLEGLLKVVSSGRREIKSEESPL